MQYDRDEKSLGPMRTAVGLEKGFTLEMAYAPALIAGLNSCWHSESCVPCGDIPQEACTATGNCKCHVATQGYSNIPRIQMVEDIDRFSRHQHA